MESPSDSDSLGGMTYAAFLKGLSVCSLGISHCSRIAFRKCSACTLVVEPSNWFLIMNVTDEVCAINCKMVSYCYQVYFSLYDFSDKQDSLFESQFQPYFCWHI